MSPSPAKCPICERPVPIYGEDAKYQPFCSKRCKEIDFFRWCDGKYAIVEPIDPFDVDEERLWSSSDDAE